MPKKSSGRAKGIRLALQWHRVWSKDCDEKQDVVRNHKTRRACRFSFVRQLTSVSYGRYCFNLMTAWCEKLKLVGFCRTQNGDYVLLDGRAQALHYTALVWYLAVCMQKIISTLQAFLYDGLGPVSFICLSVSAVHIYGVLLGTGVVLRPRESIAVLKSWSSDLPSVRQINGASKFDPFDDFSTRLKVICYFYMTIGVSLGMSLMTLALDFPVSLVPMLTDGFGVLFPSILRPFAWKVVFLPLEFLSIFPPMLMAGFSTAMMFMGTGALRNYLEPVRKTEVRSLQIRRKVEQAYVQVELFSRIFHTWIRLFFPFWLLMVAVGVILTFFMSIRNTSFPFILYMNYPPSGCIFLLILFWHSHDMVRVTRASEVTLGVLCKYDAPYFGGMTRSKRFEIMKRAKAMRPLVFPLADCKFSLNVPIDTWEEIMNQLIFLLSL